MNASFAPFFAAGADFQQANLNQPFRFGNVTTAELSSLINLSNLNLASPATEASINMYGLTNYVAGLTPMVSRVEYVNGYLANSNVNSQQYLFFLPGFFDTQLVYAGELTKQPVTVGELLTLSSVPMVNAFAGPVLIITGCESPTIPPRTSLMSCAANDLPYCGGNCLATGNPEVPSIPATAAKSFPKVESSNFEAYIQPNTGHGLNFHYNATGAYDVIQNFLGSKGL